jgi:hypothetical protein
MRMGWTSQLRCWTLPMTEQGAAAPRTSAPPRTAAPASPALAERATQQMACMVHVALACAVEAAQPPSRGVCDGRDFHDRVSRTCRSCAKATPPRFELRRSRHLPCSMAPAPWCDDGYGVFASFSGSLAPAELRSLQHWVGTVCHGKTPGPCSARRWSVAPCVPSCPPCRSRPSMCASDVCEIQSRQPAESVIGSVPCHASRRAVRPCAAARGVQSWLQNFKIWTS